ncbi:hypothetical protein CCP3SC1AL1_2280004 [Gammaproteobacteria bacterium]
MLMLNMASTTYKHKSSIEPMLRALKNVFDDLISETDVNMSDTTKTNRFGRIKTKDSNLKNLREQVDYNYRIWYGYPTKKETRAVNKKFYSAEEKAKIKSYNGFIDGLTKQFDDGKLTKDEFAEKKGYWLQKIDALGSYAISEKIIRKPMTLFHMTTFAINPLTAISNFGQGLFDNFTEAVGGMYFSGADMRWAYTKMMNTQINPWSSDAKKVVNIMKKLCVFETRRDELTPSGRAGLKKWQELLDKYASPYALTQSVEFMNQTATVMATLRHDGLWNKFDKEGNAKDVNVADFAQKCDKLIVYIHGDYKKPLMYDKHLWMQMIMTFKRWVPMAMTRRMGREHYDYMMKQNGAAFKGRWRSYGDFVKSFGDSPASYGLALVEVGKQLARKMMWQKTTFDKIEGLSDIDAANMRKNLNEIMWLIAVNAMLFMLRAGIAAGDDDDKTKAICTFWINRLTMMEQDVTFMANPSFWSNMSQNAVPMVRMYTNVGRVFLDVANMVSGGDDEYTTGLHVGESKIKRDLFKITPYAATIVKFEDAYLNDQNRGGLIDVIQKNVGK